MKKRCADRIQPFIDRFHYFFYRSLSVVTTRRHGTIPSDEGVKKLPDSVAVLTPNETDSDKRILLFAF